MSITKQMNSQLTEFSKINICVLNKDAKNKAIRVKIPVAFAKAYPEAHYQKIDPNNYLDFIT